MMQSFFFVFAILAACASIGSTLQCYECFPRDLAGNDKACEDPFKVNSNTQIRICGPDEVCIKQRMPKTYFDNREIPSMMTRRCGVEVSCSNLPTEFQADCHTCSEDRCNSAAKVISSFSTFIVLYIIKLFFL